MADFSVILQSPQVRAIVQQDLIERAFHDALFPGMMFRGESMPVPWQANAGDSQLFTGKGLVTPNLRPLPPNTDPTPKSYPLEQWSATANTYGDTIDSHMPTSVMAAVDLFMTNSHTIALNAAQVLNRKVRDVLYNAGLSGWTVTDGAQSGVSSLRVKRLNGFTTARRPSLAGGSQVRFAAVSSTNPLPITVVTTTGNATRTVTGFTPDTAGDEIGPGTLTLTGGSVTVDDRAAVYADDRTNIVRSGGGLQVDDIGPTDTLKFTNVRSALASMRQNNVPTHADKRFHAHVDPTQEAQVFEDSELQRLNTSLPDYVIYRDFALGEILGVVFFRNNENPITSTVAPFDGTTFSLDDPFAGELFSDGTTSGTPIHRMLITGQSAIYEYYVDQALYITDAGVVGKVSKAQIVNNGIEVNSDRIQMIIRAPLNRFQDQVATTWRFVGDWPVRTDAATGDASRYKRMQIIETGA